MTAKQLFPIPVFLALTVILAGCRARNPEVRRLPDDVRIRLAENAGENESVGDPFLIGDLLESGLTLQSVVRIVLLNSPRLHAELARIAVTRGERDMARSWMPPFLDAVLRYPKYGPSHSSTEFSLGMDAMQLFLRPLRCRMAEAEFGQARAECADAILGQLAEAQRGWFEFAGLEECLRYKSLKADAVQAALKLARSQHDAGNISDLELSQFQAAKVEAALELAALESGRTPLRERMNRLMGLTGEHLEWRIDIALPPIPEEEIALDGLEERAVSERLDLQAARTELRKAALALGIAARQITDDAEVGAMAEREADGQVWRGGSFRLSFPFTGRWRAERRTASAEYEVRRLLLEADLRDACSEVREAHAKVMAARARTLRLRDELVPQRESIVRQTLQHYNVMAAGAYALLEAKREELHARMAAAEALRDYWLARTDLAKAVCGGLTRLDATLPSVKEVAPREDVSSSYAQQESE